jgi:hypothetical protein
MNLGVTFITLFVPRVDLVDECGLVGCTVSKALPTPMAEFDLGHV